MKLIQQLMILVLVIALSSTLYAQETLDASADISELYLSHWFSVDHAEPTNLSIAPINGVSEKDRVALNFTSDDGQTVNGTLAYPTDNRDSNKLALALHPMGSDQDFWWKERSALPANKLIIKLREQGYTVITLDARRHGQRSDENFGPRELLKRAHSDEPRLYIDTIIGSVRDYRIVLKWAKAEFNTNNILAMGYSMGAQMSLLLASYEPDVDSVLAMVPPYVGSPTSPVAPRIHAKRITNTNVLWLAGSADPYSDQQQTEETFNKITSTSKKLIWFDAGHRLPNEFVPIALSFFDSLTVSEGQ